jgi:hypothetical protein
MVYYLPGTSHGTGHGFRFYDDRTTPPRWDSYDVLIANKMTYLRDDGSRPRHVLCWEPAGEDYFDFFYLGHDCWPITMYTCMFCRRGPSDLEAQDGRPPCPPPQGRPCPSPLPPTAALPMQLSVLGASSIPPPLSSTPPLENTAIDRLMPSVRSPP